MKFEKIIGFWWLVFSTVLTILFAIISFIAIQVQHKLMIVSIVIFLIGISLIILQLIVFNYQIHSRVSVFDEIKEHVKRSNNIKSHTSFDNLKTEITTRIENSEVGKIRIICYGTSGFGNLIHDLNDKKSDIKVSILVCSPDSEHIRYRDEDVPQIKKVIKICQENKNIKIRKSLIAPTIRACVLYDKSKNPNPIWASIQTYYFENDKNYNSLNYRKFYAVVADEEKSLKLLQEMDKVIKDEFDRLIKFTLKEQKLNDNQIEGALHCSKYNRITKKEYKKITKCKCQTTIDKELEELVEKKIFEIVPEATGKANGNYIFVNG